jgi:hypothetical protein
MGYEKVDGTNIRITFHKLEQDGTGRVEFRGRTNKAQIPPHLQAALLASIHQESFQRAFDLDKSGDAPITLYGEGFGKKIQKGGGNYGEPSFCLFDVKIGDIWMEQHFVTEVAHSMGLQRAPAPFCGILEDAVARVREGFMSHWGNFTAEGLILRPQLELYDRVGWRVIGKLKHKDFPQ